MQILWYTPTLEVRHVVTQAEEDKKRIAFVTVLDPPLSVNISRNNRLPAHLTNKSS